MNEWGCASANFQAALDSISLFETCKASRHRAWIEVASCLSMCLCHVRFPSEQIAFRTWIVHDFQAHHDEELELEVREDSCSMLFQGFSFLVCKIGPDDCGVGMAGGSHAQGKGTSERPFLTRLPWVPGQESFFFKVIKLQWNQILECKMRVLEVVRVCS